MPWIQTQKTPMPSLSPEVRRRDFAEVNTGYTLAQAQVEAQRCLLCQVPVCEEGCPVGVPIKDMIALLSQGCLEEAALRVLEVNRLPAICGRVCPQENQCELRCVLNNGKQQPVAIGYLERVVGDWLHTHHRPPERPQRQGRAKVAVVGSGPASLTCAGDLARLGYKVTIFEALHAPGGVLSYGIPAFRLPREVLQADLRTLEELGVGIQTNVVVGKTITLHQLTEELGYAAVFVGTGAGLPRFMGLPGENLKGVYSANEFLTRINLMRAHRFPHSDTPVKIGQSLAVIGAGDTAMDAARTALRAGAQEVLVIYRRSEKEMGARHEEYVHAREEGVAFHFLTNPVRFLGTEEGWLRAIACVRMELGEPDASGRPRPLPVAGSEFVIPVATAVLALGTMPNRVLLQATPDLQVTKSGHLVVHAATGATSRQGVFAGGDITEGDDTVIRAMGDGRRAARAIHEYLLRQLSP